MTFVKGHKSRFLHGLRPRGMRTETTRLYDIWANAKQRCLNPRNQRYADYGGRGITMCDRWKNSVKAFMEDMGPRPPDRTLERRDNDGNYEPTNCYWATWEEQRNNKRMRQSYPERGTDGRFKVA